MSPQEIQEWGRLLLEIKSNGQWLVFGILILCVGCAALVWKVLSKYSEKVGELDAISDRFDELKQQLKENTEIVAKVNAAVSHDDWVLREWKVLRRTKLETLLTKVFEVHPWQSDHVRKELFDRELDPGQSPVSQIQLITLLYFPELKTEVSEFLKHAEAIHNLTLETSLALIEIKGKYETAKNLNDLPAMSAAHQERMTALTQHQEKQLAIFSKQLSAKAALETKANEVFNAVFAPKTPANIAPVAPQ